MMIISTPDRSCERGDAERDDGREQRGPKERRGHHGVARGVLLIELGIRLATACGQRMFANRIGLAERGERPIDRIAGKIVASSDTTIFSAASWSRTTNHVKPPATTRTAPATITKTDSVRSALPATCAGGVVAAATAGPATSGGAGSTIGSSGCASAEVMTVLLHSLAPPTLFLADHPSRGVTWVVNYRRSKKLIG